MKFLGAFILLSTAWIIFIVILGMKLNKSTEEVREASIGGFIIIGLICLGLFFIF